jgi:hypothetical protein
MIQEIFENIRDTLQYAAPSFLGSKYIDKLFTPPRYVWIYLSDSFTGSNNPNENPRQLHEQHASVAVHVWGKTYTETEHLRAALITAFRQQLSGENYILGSSAWTELEDGKRGVVCTQEVQLITGLVEQLLPLAPADPPGTGGGVNKDLVDPTDNTVPEGTPDTFLFEQIDPPDPSMLRAGEDEDE